jgi:hypothetical protein
LTPATIKHAVGSAAWSKELALASASGRAGKSERKKEHAKERRLARRAKNARSGGAALADLADELFVPAERKLLARVNAPRFGEVADAPPERLAFSRKMKSRVGSLPGAQGGAAQGPGSEPAQGPASPAQGPPLPVEPAGETAGARLARTGSETIRRLLLATEAGARGEASGDARALLKERMRLDAVEAYKALKQRRRETGEAGGRRL